MFHRLSTDGTAQEVDLRSFYAGPTQTWCWIICGGPSLSQLPIDRIISSPAPKFAVNLAGSGLLRPDFWTSYDPTARFHRSIFLDAGIIKFVHLCRAMDLLPETTFKVCDAPATLFFERDRERGFYDFLRPGAGRSPAIVDWQDSLVQAIDIAAQLGFRKLVLAGCDMFIAPSGEQINRARQIGIDYQPRELLRGFYDRCRSRGIAWEELCSINAPVQYHFDEQKPLEAAVQTDDHYFRVAQYLRLSRRSMALAGVELISVTPVSRLNDDFPWIPFQQVCDQILRDVGNPGLEQTRGRYTSTDSRKPRNLGPMKDFKPHFWKAEQPKSTAAQKIQHQQAMMPIGDIEIPIAEIG